MEDLSFLNNKNMRKRKRKAKTSKATEIVYTADKIVAKRYRKKTVQYRVRWAGYTANDDTWEPTKNILDQGLITDYEKSQKQAKTAKWPEAKNVTIPSKKRKKANHVGAIVALKKDKKGKLNVTLEKDAIEGIKSLSYDEFKEKEPQLVFNFLESRLALLGDKMFNGLKK